MGAVTLSYRASATITISPENIASSATFVAGVESTVIDNTSNKDEDNLIGGVWTSGTTPTANTQVQIFVVAARDDAPTWGDVFDGTSSAETVTTAGVLAGIAKLAAVLNVDTNTSNRAYECAPFSVAQLFGGILPPKYVLYISHNTAVNSNSTAGNHVWKVTGVSRSVA